MVTAGSSLHVVWFDDRDIQIEKYFPGRRTTRGRSPEENLSQAPGESTMPLLAATNQYLHAAWGDRKTGVLQVFYRRRAMQ